jgi:predicted lipoprotein with Yx(FWY)xxD motif
MTRHRLPLFILVLTIVAIVGAIVATSGATKKVPQRTAAAGSAISLSRTPVGQALVDARGRTLYLFAGDKPNVSRLSVAGQAVWPPFTSTTLPMATAGISAGQIGTIAGTKQITFNGHPLYYYVGDRNPGQTAGQGLNEFGARWYVLSSRGAAITSTASSLSASPSGTSPSSGGAAGYGY